MHLLTIFSTKINSKIRRQSFSGTKAFQPMAKNIHRETFSKRPFSCTFHFSSLLISFSLCSQPRDNSEQFVFLSQNSHKKSIRTSLICKYSFVSCFSWKSLPLVSLEIGFLRGNLKFRVINFHNMKHFEGKNGSDNNRLVILLLHSFYNSPTMNCKSFGAGTFELLIFMWR